MKLLLSKLLLMQIKVAPLVGAWIETSIRLPLETILKVAPLVGAWIETAIQP